MDFLDRLLLVVGLLFTGLVFLMLCLSVWLDFSMYSDNISLAKSIMPPDISAILAFSRAFNFSVLRMVGIFLGFILALVGALYVLRTASAEFKLDVGNDTTGRVNIASSSPGLVVVIAGVAIVVATIMTPSEINYQPPTITYSTTGVNSMNSNNARNQECEEGKVC